MNIGSAKRVLQPLAWLVGHKAEALFQPVLFDEFGELPHLVAASDHQEDDVASLLEKLRRTKDRAKLMRASEVARVADNELVLQSPLGAQRVLLMSDRDDVVIITPVRNEHDLLWR